MKNQNPPEQFLLSPDFATSANEELSKGREVAAALARWYAAKEILYRIPKTTATLRDLSRIRDYADQNHIGVNEAVGILMNILCRYSDSGRVRRASITGAGAARLLSGEVKNRYPNDEHKAMRRDEQEDREFAEYLNRHGIDVDCPSQRDCDSLEDWVQRYRQSIEHGTKVRSRFEREKRKSSIAAKAGNSA